MRSGIEAGMNVTVVSVTYGRRASLLTQVLDAARAQGVVEAVVIDNGSVDQIADIMNEYFGPWAYVHSMGGNKGSAPAFKKGIELALERGAEHILLLDDDNILTPRAVQALQAAFADQVKDRAPCDVAVFGFRRDRNEVLVERVRSGRSQRMKSAFHSFHVFDIQQKILRRFQTPKQGAMALPALIEVYWGPYGGMMFHRSLVDKIGLPDPNFVLYEDDTEFTRRLVKAGGRLWVVTDAEIVDAQTSENLRVGRETAVSILLTRSSDSHVFYQFRNSVYSSFYCREGMPAVVALNAFVYMLILFALAIRKNRLRRLALLFLAFRDGVVGRLGPSSEFPI